MTVTTNRDTGRRDMQISKTATLAQTNFLELSPDSEHAEKEPSAVAIHAESRRLASLRFILFYFFHFTNFRRAIHHEFLNKQWHDFTTRRTKGDSTFSLSYKYTFPSLFDIR